MRIVSLDSGQQLHIIRRIASDCGKYGHGRKAWWAEKIGVSPMTISHWLSNRRRPNAQHLQTIQLVVDELESIERLPAWSDLLWQHYYDNTNIPGATLTLCAEHLAKVPGLETRLIALVSLFIEGQRPLLPTPPIEASWRNRLGWLYESAGIVPNWNPVSLPVPAPLVQISTKLNRSDLLQAYLQRQQTALGTRWNLYDTDIARIKEKLSWRNQAESVATG